MLRRTVARADADVRAGPGFGAHHGGKGSLGRRVAEVLTEQRRRVTLVGPINTVSPLASRECARTDMPTTDADG